MEDIWEAHKENIRRLYINEDKTCRQVAAEMKAEYGFEAKAGQYHRHFEKWKFRKNLSEGEWKLVGRRIQKRKAEQNKESELRINGFVMHQKKIEKALSRYSETIFERAQRQAISRRSCTPEGIVIATPPRHEPVTPLSFPVYVENLPFLRFQRILVQEAPVFDQLLSSFRRLSIKERYPQDDSILLGSLASSQSSSSAPLSALLHMVWDSSSLTETYPTIPPSFLKKFTAVLLGVTNNSPRFQHIQPFVAEMVLESLQLREGKAMALKLLGEQSPFFETLVELLFKYALSECNVELVKFLLQYSHIGPNDILRFGKFSRFPLIGSRSVSDKAWTTSSCMGYGEAITPMEYSIKHRSSVLLRALRRCGATIDVRGRRVKDMLSRIPKHSFDEVISFMLDEGLMDIIDASEILGEKFDIVLSRRIFGRAVEDDFMQHLPALKGPPAEEPPTEESPTEEPVAETPLSEKPPAEELLEWSVRSGNTSLTESLLEQRTAITEATFLCALQCGNLHVVNKALEAGTNVNIISAFGSIPLKIAAERGDLSTVQSLLRHGAEVEPATSCSPFFWSIPSHEVVKLLLKRGASLHILDDDGVPPLCHFLLRQDPDTAMFLIDWGACLGRHPKHTPLWVPTPLQIAASKGYDAVVEKLLDRNVDVNEEAPFHGHDISNRPNFQEFYGDTALSSAIRNSWGRHTRIIDRLISKGANPNAVSRYRDTPLSIAIDHGDKAAVQSLVKAGASLVDPEAFRAGAASGDINFLRQSLKDGLCLDDIGTFALSNAVHSWRIHPDIKMSIVVFLIDSGARANGMRLVHYFIKQNPGLSQLLLSHGACLAAEINSSLLEHYWISRACGNISEVVKTLQVLLAMPSRWGELAKSFFLYRGLCFAAMLGDFDLTKAHLDAGIDVGSSRTDMETKVTYDDSRIRKVGRMFLRCPIAHGCFPSVRPWDPPRKESQGKYTPQIPPKYLIPTEPELPRATDTQNKSNTAIPPQFQSERSLADELLDCTYNLEPYMISRDEVLELECSDPNRYHLRKVASWLLLGAAVEGGPAIIKLLHEAGLDVNGELCTLEGHGLWKLHNTALQYTIQKGKYASADALIEAGADVNAPAYADRGLTALQAAAIHGHIGIACKLLEKGAEVNAPGGSFGGRTALEGAAEWGRLDMVQLLLDNGADITDSAFGEAQYRNSTKFAKDEGYPAISRLIKRHRLSMGYSDLSCDD